MDQNQNQYEQQSYQAPYISQKNAAYYRSQARIALKGNWPIAILVALIASLLGAVSSESFSCNFSIPLPFDFTSLFPGSEGAFSTESLVTQMNELLSSVGIVFIIIFATVALFTIAFSLFFSSPIHLGYERFNLDLIDGNSGGICLETLFSSFKKCYLKSVGLGLVYSLIMSFAPIVPLIPFAIVAPFLMGWAGFTSGTVNLSAFLILAVLLLIFVGISCAVSLILSYRYRFAFMIMAEYPTIGIFDALRNSANLMKGNKWKLFCLDFSFIGWILLASCTCGLGMIVLMPYMYAASAAFYNDIANRQAAKETEFPSINPDDYVGM
ncbi:MAG: DUF975 family protein [Clostridia bacterium]|nr:DUF975 family protein [Clostridia bacterium]